MFLLDLCSCLAIFRSDHSVFLGIFQKMSLAESWKRSAPLPALINELLSSLLVGVEQDVGKSAIFP